MRRGSPLDWPSLVIRVVLALLIVLPVMLIFGTLHSLLLMVSGQATFSNRFQFLQDSWRKVWEWTLNGWTGDLSG